MKGYDSAPPQGWPPMLPNQYLGIDWWRFMRLATMLQQDGGRSNAPEWMGPGVWWVGIPARRIP